MNVIDVIVSTFYRKHMLINKRKYRSELIYSISKFIIFKTWVTMKQSIQMKNKYDIRNQHNFSLLFHESYVEFSMK